MRGLRRREIALSAEAEPVLMNDARAMGLCNLLSAIGAAAIDDQFFGGKWHTIQAATNDPTPVHPCHHHAGGNRSQI